MTYCDDHHPLTVIVLKDIVKAEALAKPYSPLDLRVVCESP